KAIARWAGLVLAAVGLSEGQTAAPPARHRALTRGEREWVQKTQGRLATQMRAGAFEEAARLARDLYELHRRVQGSVHPATVDARQQLEAWRRLSKVPAQDRPLVVRSLAANQRGVALLSAGNYREAEPHLREALTLGGKVLDERHPEMAFHCT